MSDVVPVSTVPMPRIRKCDLDRPWQWLTAGWHDLIKAGPISLLYGLAVSAAGAVLTALIWIFDWLYLVLPLAAGFMFMGPILAVGLYYVSRKLGRGEKPRLLDSMMAWLANLQQIALMGLALMLFLLAWVRIAQIIFALFFAENPPRPEAMFVVDVFLSAESIPFLTVGTIVGGLLAALVYSISVISIPLLVDKPANVFTAIATSVAAVRENFWTMALWAWLIVLFIGAGLVTFYVGLIVTMPLIGHATWHAYKDLVVWDED
jgi:uncharacterized membrane protein